MIKKFLFINILFLGITTNAFAYKVGDTVHSDVIEKLSAKDNKIIIVDFFASWCHSCAVELPYLSKLNNEIDKSRIEIIGIDGDKEIKKGIAFQNKLMLNFRVINDNDFELCSKFNPLGMPALYYIKDKKIVKVRIGAIDNIDKVIKKDLDELVI